VQSAQHTPGTGVQVRVLVSAHGVL